MRRKLTKKTIDSIPAGPPKGKWYGDAEMGGLFLVSYPAVKSFFVRYTTPGGKRRVIKIGRYGVLTPEQARDRARELLASASLGQDPGAARDKARTVPSWGDWVDTHLARVRLTKKSPREDERFLGVPRKGRDPEDPYAGLWRRWKARPIDTVTAEDIEGFRTELGKSHRPASNRWLASVRSCLSAAKRSGHIALNPAKGLTPFRENPPRQRTLAAGEMEALVKAIQEDPDPFARAALFLLIETGARLSEVTRAKWEDLDLGADIPLWRIPSPKSGNAQVQPLASTTVALLAKLPRFGPYVIAGRFKDRPRADLRGPWERALERAGLTGAGLRGHDIRRTFGLHLSRSAGLHVASKLLRHSTVRITERVYSPLGLKELHDALEHRAPVVPISRKKKA